MAESDDQQLGSGFLTGLMAELGLTGEVFRSFDLCEDCGCWTGGSGCPYCTDAPHPRGRW